MTENDGTNLRIWDALKKPPQEALKEIKGGRLKGKSDINPQWRMQAMTRQFGPCGVGWRYTIERLWTEAVGISGEVVAFASVNVFFRHSVDGGAPLNRTVEIWSEPIPGIGGNMLVEQESAGPHVSDECYKMAVTDALSVAFKALGVAADVYMGKFDSKYDQHGGTKGGGGQRPRRQPKDEGFGNCPKCGVLLRKINRKDGSGFFFGCQGYPDCKYTTWPDKDGKPKPAAAPKTAPTKAQHPATLSDAEPGLAPKVAAQEAEEMCPLCGNHPANPDGHCPNEHRAEVPPQEQAAQEWRPQHCGRSMMPRRSSGGEAPRWHCPKCRETRGMSDAERKRVGL